MKLNRRGFLASLAALAVAPKLEAIARVLPAAPVLAPLPITGLAGWLPRLTIMGSIYCPKDRVYFLDGGLVEPQPGVSAHERERRQSCRTRPGAAQAASGQPTVVSGLTEGGVGLPGAAPASCSCFVASRERPKQEVTIHGHIASPHVVP